MRTRYVTTNNRLKAGSRPSRQRYFYQRALINGDAVADPPENVCSVDNVRALSRARQIARMNW